VSAGNCSAGGYYVNSKQEFQAFVVNEVNGTWGTAQEVPGTADPVTGGGSLVTSVSCASAGNCGAGGYYTPDPDAEVQAFVVSEVNGTWGTAQAVSGIGVGSNDDEVSAVSCRSAGNCGAVGVYAGEAFVADEVNGTWGGAQDVPGLATLSDGGYAQASSISCGSVGNCVAGGNYETYNSHEETWIADEVGGIWGNAEEVPGTAALNAGNGAAVSSVSCASAGNCGVGGYYQDASNHHQAFVADEVGGAWGNAEEVPGTAALNAGGNAMISSLSCASAGNCSAGGFYYEHVSGDEEAFIVSEVGGAWGMAEEVPGTAALNVGGNAVVNSVSCASAGNCGAGGYYTDHLGYEQAFLVSEAVAPSGTTTAITSVTSHPVAGQPVTVAISVKASRPGSGPPRGTVSVSSGPAACHATLTGSGSAASGHCTITEGTPGTYSLTAHYPGSTGFSPSTSKPSRLVVAKATSKTALKLSKPSVAYGDEQALSLSVTVTPRFTGIPAGTVTIVSGTTTLCTITLKAGKGTCKPASGKALKPGKYSVTARYAGSKDFDASTSPPATLLVTKPA
jgi:hypothetical protein